MVSPAVTLRKNWRFWLGILLGLVCLAWLAYTVDWADVGTALKEMDRFGRLISRAEDQRHLREERAGKDEHHRGYLPACNIQVVEGG